MRECGSCLSAQWAWSGSVGKTVVPAGIEVITRTRERARGSAAAFHPGAVVSVVVGKAIVPVVAVGAEFGARGGAGDDEKERTEGVQDSIRHG